ncbi:probable pectinesterase/pectinesterase inhibitor 47 [Malania oleifera]|uniref:probable pectinesterase/pectinesterase inhibitor 47 n=1 Tax=Malania oleifera TaxID=397392 RepID=UPI0025ADCB89|nr:probable pectinesterase/pectinesterase inhibitor 47 [Malania oleifera]
MKNLCRFFPPLLFLTGLVILVSVTHAHTHDLDTHSPTLACQSTSNPKRCRFVLLSFGSPSPDPLHYAKLFLKQCLKDAHRLSRIFKSHVQLHHERQSLSEAPRLRLMEARALEDCRQLVEFTMDDLQAARAELPSAGSPTGELGSRVQTQLTAVVTYQDTCLEGLKESGSKIGGAVTAPVASASELFSLSLSLVSRTLGSAAREGQSGAGSRDRFPGEAYWAHQPISTLTKVLERRDDYSDNGGSMRLENLRELLKESGIKVKGLVTVGTGGGGNTTTANFTTIGEAIATAPNDTNFYTGGYFVIYIQKGVYEENLLVPKNKSSIMMIGDGINQTVVTGSRNVADGWTTYNSATFAVAGDRFAAIDITFKNTAGPEKHQAVAVRCSADLSVFFRCSFEGFQDTLYVHTHRQFYRECQIYGTVDFIFGNAASNFQNCGIFARKPMANQTNIVTAQGRTDPTQASGISIQNCTVRPAPDLAADLNSTKSYLGRPWKNYSRTVYMQSDIDGFIDPAGWSPWSGTAGLDTLFYGEFENYGPGSNMSDRVQWPGFKVMNLSQAVRFTAYNFTWADLWLPAIVPFNVGLR